ncbi:MAG: hypothetical protein ACLTW9_00660 [Enterocloster sp.]
MTCTANQLDADRLTLQKEEVESVMWMGLGQCVEAVRNLGFQIIYLDELEMIEGICAGARRNSR